MIDFSILKLNDTQGFLEFFEKATWKNFGKEQVFKIQDHLSVLENDISLILEYPYVDQTYRDSYYEYYASKHEIYSRNCIRIAVFKETIEPELIVSNSIVRRKLIRNFLGFTIIRPTPRRPIGRSVISPKGLKNQNIVCCLAKYDIEFFGISLRVNGFPHISQDKESITCAEASLWSIVDYYSHKYREYNPLTPSKIRRILEESTSKRLIPSEGLTIAQISYSLSKIGFGSMIYHAKLDKQEEIKRILYSYVESGIPLIIGIENSEKTFRHAIVCFGHEQIHKVQNQEESILDIADWHRNFIVMDDNLSPYHFLDPNLPGKNYNHNPPFFISYLVIPLYKKVYLEYRLAEKLVRTYLNETLLESKPDSQIAFRLFLTSSRSFKQNIFNRDLPEKIQMMIIRNSLPRFVWICEFGEMSDFENEKISGFFIIDATGSESVDSIIFCFFRDIIQHGEKKFKLKNLDPNQKFNLYRNNLKGKWNKWRS